MSIQPYSLRYPEMDAMTGLPNRKSFEASMDRLLEQGGSGYALFIDMNDFKSINHCFGYRAGDALLIAFAHYLLASLTPAYQIFRVSGDTFALLGEGVSYRLMAQHMEEVLHRCRLPWSIGSHSTFCTVSIGALCWPRDGSTTDDICRRLQGVLTQARRSGENVLIIYSPGGECITELAQQRRAIEDMMRKSVHDGFHDFALHYQPIVCPKGSILGAEALLRFTGRDGKHIPPSSFIPLAERTGLILPIGEWVLNTAVRFCRTILNRGHKDFLMHINLSIRQLETPGFAQVVLDLLHGEGVPCRNIALEITESMAASRIQLIQDTCWQLRDAGIHISLDDFGTGYSSLKWMRTMPIDGIKIDRSFIGNMCFDNYTESFVRLIAELKSKLGIAIYAEGVEEPEQLAKCRELGIDRMQGFYFYKAMPEHELLHIMQPPRQEERKAAQSAST